MNGKTYKWTVEISPKDWEPSSIDFFDLFLEKNGRGVPKLAIKGGGDEKIVKVVEQKWKKEGVS